MAMRDLRDYLASLEAAGELRRIDQEVDWRLEAGAIAARANETGAPAPLMTRIKGDPTGASLLGSPLGFSAVSGKKHWRRTAIAMGLGPEARFWDVVDEYIKRKVHPLRPNMVSEGVCQENVIQGGALDLLSFPFPLIHEMDGGRYSSWHVNVNKDPDSAWVNWGLYRSMVYSRNRVCVQMLPNQHGPMLYYQKYEARGKPMPFCIVLGGDPLITLAAATRYPAGMSEVDIAGALRREPVAMVQAKTVDLMVPTNAEMVIEGMVHPTERLDEGPFDEYHGQTTAPPLPQPVLRVTAITHRNNPIIPFTFSGTMKDDYACISSVISSAELTWSLRDKGLLPVRGAYCPPEAVDHVCIVSANMIYSNFPRQLSCAIFSERFGMHFDKVVVCDRDVDPANASEVWQAIFHKMNPYRGVRKIEAAPGHALQAYLDPRERKAGAGASVYLDTTWPLDWDAETEIMKKCSFSSIYPKEVQEKVLSRWMTDYGYARTEWED